jgi:DNA sulfur modification protein DndD
MQLKSIKLNNFRQFKDVQVDFADGKEGKNVTIIIGENSAGKTTIEQAFFWCLYAKTPSFEDKILLNRDVLHNMQTGSQATVKVELCLYHNGIEYTLTRQLAYTKDNNGNAKPADQPLFDITRREKNGNEKDIEADLLAATVEEIMPQALSQYFFFDGERILQMGKEISGKEQVDDFKNAVRGLLGLDAMMNALWHFKHPRGGKNTVIGYYNSQFSAKGNAELEKLLKQIDDADQKLAEVKSSLETCDGEISKAKDLLKQKRSEITLYEEGKKLIEEKDGFEQDISLAEEAKHNAVTEAVSLFSRDLSSFLSLPLINRAVDFINSQNLADAIIPGLSKATLDYLKEHQKCICGRELLPGSDACNHIESLYDYVLPNSIATIARDFKNESMRRVDQTFVGDMSKDVISKIKTANEQEKIIQSKQARLERVIRRIGASGEAKDKFDELKSQIGICEEKIRTKTKEHDQLLEDKVNISRDLKNYQDRRADINANDEQNRKTEIYLAYANRIYEELNKEYTAQETEVRTRLQDTINSIFREIYNGELQLEIKDNYKISVTDISYDSGVETSSGQSIAVIFAFITALIQMAKENGQKENELLAHEVYPLVMDAPLSLFDKTRIDTVCRKIPSIAEQVVIFIKDTDGEIARDKMARYIGKEYRFDKQTNFDTRVIPGEME